MMTPPAGQVAGRAVLAVPPRERGMDEAVLPADYQRITDVVRRADGPVMVKQVCGELGISLEPARSEAMRAKLNGSPSGAGCASRPTGSSPRCCEHAGVAPPWGTGRNVHAPGGS
ncbi:hypothetical protein ACFZAG_39970 [Streptomyces sp. NPDC012403]|uniref:hypothetical protein n=1 Tax=unclassified Streptomyces TaxID=2593676 RepID=UPI0020B80705|nr:hypothetical protein [Streptomyces sp. AC558_RSS880]